MLQETCPAHRWHVMFPARPKYFCKGVRHIRGRKAGKVNGVDECNIAPGYGHPCIVRQKAGHQAQQPGRKEQLGKGSAHGL